MMTCKLILRNLKKNVQDYAIYFLTLTLAISLFYAFNAVTTAGALDSLGAEMGTMLGALGDIIEAVSVIIAVMIAFLILYVNRFLLKRRKKELGIYMLLGMKKSRISFVFVGETFLIGLLSLVAGLLVGVFFSQILTIAALKVFGGWANDFQLSLSAEAFAITIKCFVVIYVVAMIFNVFSVSGVKLIDMLLADRKNETWRVRTKAVYMIGFLLGLACMAGAAFCFQTEELLPELELLFTGMILVVIATFLFFYTISTVVLTILQRRKGFYLKGINSFLVRQISSRIQGNFVSMSAVCILLTGTILLLTTGTSIALTMTKMSSDYAPYDFCILRDYYAEEEEALLEAAKEFGVDFVPYIESSFQITEYEADLTYQTFFGGQEVSLWEHDKDLQNKKVDIYCISDYNKALKVQGKEEIQLEQNEFLLNCNYEGTREYMKDYLEHCEGIELAGRILYPKQREMLENTFYMTSIGDNDRGTLIVPDEMVEGLTKSGSIVQGFFYDEVNINEVHALLDYFIWDSGVPEDKPFAWNTRERMNTMFYSAFGLPVFFFSYIGIVFMLICVALISVQQLTEISDNKYRYLILQKQGVKQTMMKATIQRQVGVYFMAPLLLAGTYSAIALPVVMTRVSNFYNMKIGVYLIITAFALLLIYGGYYLATAASCKRMILREKE